eukprot:COSAG01_NODE_4269_length_5195_cov_11.029435_2_plen_746_part_00
MAADAQHLCPFGSDRRWEQIAAREGESSDSEDSRSPAAASAAAVTACGYSRWTGGARGPTTFAEVAASPWLGCNHPVNGKPYYCHLMWGLSWDEGGEYEPGEGFHTQYVNCTWTRPPEMDQAAATTVAAVVTTAAGSVSSGSTVTAAGDAVASENAAAVLIQAVVRSRHVRHQLYYAPPRYDTCWRCRRTHGVCLSSGGCNVFVDGTRICCCGMPQNSGNVCSVHRTANWAGPQGRAPCETLRCREGVAAVRLQAVVRCWWTRRLPLREKRCRAAVRIQAVVQSWLTRQRLLHETENAAAVRLQAVARSWLARQRLLREKHRLAEAEAAVRLQAVVRSWQAQQRLLREKRRPAETAAAVRLQAVVRSWRAQQRLLHEKRRRQQYSFFWSDPRWKIVAAVADAVASELKYDADVQLCDDFVWPAAHVCCDAARAAVYVATGSFEGDPRQNVTSLFEGGPRRGEMIQWAKRAREVQHGHVSEDAVGEPVVSRVYDDQRAEQVDAWVMWRRTRLRVPPINERELSHYDRHDSFARDDSLVVTTKWEHHMIKIALLIDIYSCDDFPHKAPYRRPYKIELRERCQFRYIMERLQSTAYKLLALSQSQRVALETIGDVEERYSQGVRERAAKKRERAHVLERNRFRARRGGLKGGNQAFLPACNHHYYCTKCVCPVYVASNREQLRSHIRQKHNGSLSQEHDPSRPVTRARPVVMAQFRGREKNVTGAWYHWIPLTLLCPPITSSITLENL